jgi:hypothetical protein
MEFEISLMKRENNKGPRKEPWRDQELHLLNFENKSGIIKTAF